MSMCSSVRIAEREWCVSEDEHREKGALDRGKEHAKTQEEEQDHHQEEEARQ
jgi:hypothetical protein